MDSLSFTDGKGVPWTVREEGADDGPVADRDQASFTWLTFETDLEARRLWTFPDDWRRLDPAQLEALCRRAHTVVARFPRQRRAIARERTKGS